MTSPSTEDPAAGRPWLVMGLGNPGSKYAGNRHNVGQMVVDELARMGGAPWRPVRGRGAGGAVGAEIRLGTGRGGMPGPRVVLGRSTGYMNTSGGPTAGLLAYFDIPVEHVIVVHDELDIPFGAVRLKRGGGEGGHNGLRDISKALGTKDYLRVRVGIGRPPGRMDAADFVLRDFGSTERRDLPLLITDSCDAVEDLVTTGLVAAQQRWHSPDKS